MANTTKTSGDVDGLGGGTGGKGGTTSYATTRGFRVPEPIEGQQVVGAIQRLANQRRWLTQLANSLDDLEQLNAIDADATGFSVSDTVRLFEKAYTDMVHYTLHMASFHEGPEVGPNFDEPNAARLARTLLKDLGYGTE